MIPKKFFTLFFPLLLASGLSLTAKSDLLQVPVPFNGQPAILPVDQAFIFSEVQQDQVLRLFWQIEPGYYLYRDKFHFEVVGPTGTASTIAVDIQPGIEKLDEIFGQVQVFEGLLELRLPNLAVDHTLRIKYQGCADAGYCYPPQVKVVKN